MEQELYFSLTFCNCQDLFCIGFSCALMAAQALFPSDAKGCSQCLCCSAAQQPGTGGGAREAQVGLLVCP